MADEAAPAVAARRPNKTLAMVLLVVQVLGTAYFMIMSFWDFFHEHRGPAMWNMSYGVLWFLFFGWAARASMRPFPAQ